MRCRLAAQPSLRKALAVALMGLLGSLSASCGGGPAKETAEPGLVTVVADDPSIPVAVTGFGQGPYMGPCYERPIAGERIAWLPDDLPFPDGTYPVEDLQDDGRFKRAVLAVPLTYGEFVQFVLARWPGEGWILGRGESEAGEAEDGFVRGDTYGAFRARRVYCEPGWSEILLALGGASPTIAPITTGSTG